MKWKKIILAAVIITCVVVLFVGLFSFCDLMIDTSWEIEDLKNSLCMHMPYEKASKEKSDEFFDNYDKYGGLQTGWNVKTEMILKTGKAKAVRFSTLEAICRELNCQPGDILEYDDGTPLTLIHSKEA